MLEDWQRMTPRKPEFRKAAKLSQGDVDEGGLMRAICLALALISASTYATNIYRCDAPDGSVTYTGIRCASGLRLTSTGEWVSVDQAQGSVTMAPKARLAIPKKQNQPAMGVSQPQGLVVHPVCSQGWTAVEDNVKSWLAEMFPVNYHAQKSQLDLQRSAFFDLCSTPSDSDKVKIVAGLVSSFGVNFHAIKGQLDLQLKAKQQLR